MHKKINAILIPLIILALLAVFFVLPAKEFSERENRYLAAVPELSWKTVKSGKFMEDIADYVSDHFPFRDFWIGVNTGVARAKGKTLINGVYFSEDGYLIEEYSSSGNMEKLAKAVNAFASKVDAKVTFMAVPTSSVINEDKLPSGVGCGSEQAADLKVLYDSLECNTVPLIDVLREGNAKEQMYYRLDHHWTVFGASIAYEEYSALADTWNDPALLAYKQQLRTTAASLPYGSEADFELYFSYHELELVSDDFRGTLFNKVGECGLGYDSIYAPIVPEVGIIYETETGVYGSIYDESKLSTADQYAFFLSGNHPFVTVTNTFKTDKKVKDANGNVSVVHWPDILIIKDSYANCMIPYMLSDYHSITIVDPRYYGDVISTYVNENGIDEVLFIYNMNTLGTDLGIRRVQ